VGGGGGGGGVVCRDFERNEKYIWVRFLVPEFIKILNLNVASASLRHAYLGSFLLDPEDIRKLSTGAIWNFGEGPGLL